MHLLQHLTCKNWTFKTMTFTKLKMVHFRHWSIWSCSTCLETVLSQSRRTCLSGSRNWSGSSSTTTGCRPWKTEVWVTWPAWLNLNWLTIVLFATAVWHGKAVLKFSLDNQYYYTVTIWISVKSGIQIFQRCPVVKQSGFQMMARKPCKKSLFYGSKMFGFLIVCLIRWSDH